MAGNNLIPDPNQRTALENAVDSVWQTLKRPFTVYTEAQVAYISTSSTYSRFGQRDQNVSAPQVNPQAQTIYGTIMYGAKQQWDPIAPENRSNYDQDKIRNSMGQVRIKVDATGYEIMKNCKKIQLDGFDFTITSNSRPHGLFTPQRYTFFLDKTD